MNKNILLHIIVSIIFASSLGCDFLLQDSRDDSIKVFILAGGSNMVGKGIVEPNRTHISKNGGEGTLRFLVDDEMQRNKYGHLEDESGQWSELENVWLVDSDYSGPLSPGRKNTFGPELQFGYEVANHYQSNKILIIKTAWDGKNLYQDFRPPSSSGATGYYYTEMLSKVYRVLDDLESIYPDYDGEDYEIAGFGWNQGWDDRTSPEARSEYQENCVNLINDLRNEFNLPSLPIIIASTGMSGWSDTRDDTTALLYSQMAVENDQRLWEKSNVAAIDTRDFWREGINSPSDIDYYWNNNAETYFLIGEEMGQIMTALLPQQKRAPFFEAENFSRKGKCLFKSTGSGFTGTGYMDFGGNGSWIAWNNIKAEKAGSYTLKFKYANNEKSRRCSIIVNGQNVGNIPFISTGSDTNWKYAGKKLKVNLKKGINRIKVKAITENGGPNLDHMEIVGLGNGNPGDDPGPDPIGVSLRANFFD